MIALRLEAAAVVGLLALAAIVRADGFIVVQRFTDETLEVARGLELLQDGGLPLIGYPPHKGHRSGRFRYASGEAALDETPGPADTSGEPSSWLW